MPHYAGEPKQDGGIIPATEKVSFEYSYRVANSVSSKDANAAITSSDGSHSGFSLLSFPIGIRAIQ